MSADHAGTGRRQVYADLVAGLLDARDDPATERFDAELEAALGHGTITPETAHRLRFWQRASVRTLADHTRTALPTALGALEASRREARHAVEEMATTLGPDPQTHDARTEAGPETASGDTPGAASSTPDDRPSSLEQRRNRLIVADLVPAVPDVRTTRR